MRSPRAIWLWFVAGFSLATLLLLIPIHVWTTRLPDHSRNPGFRRGWYEFVRTTPPRQAGEKLVLIISNSQGYGREVNESETYAMRLQALLRAQGQPARVVNWSIPGGQFFDFLMLAAAARDLQPDVLVLPLASVVFSLPDRPHEGPDSWTSDLHHLLSVGAIRRRLASADRQSRLTVSLWGDILIGRAWPIWRWRQWPAAWLARHAQLAPLLPDDVGASWYGPPPRRFLQPPPERAMLLQSNQAERFLDLAQPVAPRIILVNQPRHSTWLAQTDRVWAPLTELAQARGIEVIQLQHTVPDDSYLTATHLDRAGHDIFARRLLEHLP